MRHSKRWTYLIWTSHSLWKEFLDWRSIEYFAWSFFSNLLVYGHFVDFNFPASEAQKVSKVDSEIRRPLASGLRQPMLVWFCRRNRSCAYPVRDVEQSWWKFEFPSLQMLCSLAHLDLHKIYSTYFCQPNPLTWKTIRDRGLDDEKVQEFLRIQFSKDGLTYQFRALTIRWLSGGCLFLFKPWVFSREWSWKSWDEGLLLIAYLFVLYVYIYISTEKFQWFCQHTLWQFFPPKERHFDTDDWWFFQLFFFKCIVCFDSLQVFQTLWVIWKIWRVPATNEIPKRLTHKWSLENWMWSQICCPKLAF